MAVMAVGLLSACSGDESTFTTLPPIRTTTTTSTTPETDQNRIFYEVKSGESLSIIARSFGVTVDSIVELNKISNPNTIEVGLIIEIPRDVVLVDVLPDPPPSP